MTESTYRVNGMTCEHCVNAVREEVGGLEAVTDVSVQLVAHGTSTLVVQSERELTRAEVGAAVEEAGYSLAEGDELADDVPPS